MSAIVTRRGPSEPGIESILFSKVSSDSGKTDRAEELGIRPVFFEIDVYQYNSIQNSLEQFVAEEYRQIPTVLAFYRERDGERLYFHIVTADDEEGTLERVFEPERFFYTRFPTEQLDFQVLPGRELESCIPSTAILMWRR